MRPILWGSGVKYGDPNARWGSPSYLLEPGDPGYVADPRSASFPATQRTTKKRNIMKGDFVKRGDREFSQQLINFCVALPTYAATVGVSSAQSTAVNADSLRFKWELDARDVCAGCAEQMTKWKDISRKGGNYPTAGSPTEMTLPSPEPLAVAPGIEARFRALVAQIKAHGNYNPGIGEALGIEGEEITGPDLDAVQPVLKLKVTAGGVMVGWGWEGNGKFLKACEIEADRGTGGGMTTLTIDFNPNYLDTFPLPATAQKWTYRAVYRDGNGRVGQWSPPVSINVGG
jgi:hypothetical protein